MTTSPFGFNIRFINERYFGLVLDVMPGFAEEKATHRSIRKQRIVRIGENGDDIGRFQLADAAVDDAGSYRG